MKKNNFITILLICTVLIYGCKNSGNNTSSNSNQLKGSISLSGAFALYPMAQNWADEFMKLHPDVKIDISAGGAGKGMTDVLSGLVDLAMFSKEISTSEKQKGAWGISVTKDAVFPVINSHNPYLDELKRTGLKKQQFYDIFISGKINSWEKLLKIKQKIKIDVFTRSDACGAAEMWAKYLDKKQEDIKGIGVFGDPGIADAVKKEKYAIGFNNLIYVYDINTIKKSDGLEIIPIDLNENGKIDKEENFYGTIKEVTDAVRNNLYPSPPSRELYFVSKGKPNNKIVIEFLKWILTDGQKFISNAGYVELPQEVIQKELKKLQ